MSPVTGDSLVLPKGGRPRAPEPGIRVSTWITESHFDRLNRLANLHDLSVSKFVARVIERAIDRAID